MSKRMVGIKEKSASERALLEKLCSRALTDQEAFEAERDLLGAFAWLLEQDEKQKARRANANENS